MKVGWFTSARGPGSLALLSAACEAIESGRLPVEIAYVFCNRAAGEHEPADRLLDFASRQSLPIITLSSARFRRQAKGEMPHTGQPLPGWRWDYDRAVWELVRPFGADLAVLAGYQLIAPELCERMDLLNLHPAAPGGPIGLWQEVVWQLIAARSRDSGITIFRAIPALDAGPALAYCRYGLRDNQIDPLWDDVDGRDVATLRAGPDEELPLFREIRRRGAEREVPLLISTLAALASGCLRIVDGVPVDAAGNPAPALDLSEEVERQLAPRT
jgi:phosphoribosylglycinamide formyltransferase 1